MQTAAFQAYLNGDIVARAAAQGQAGNDGRSRRVDLCPQVPALINLHAKRKYRLPLALSMP